MNLIKNHKERFLAIDANAIIHRAFHAYPPSLQTEDGLQVNAVYGFTTMLLSALKTFDPKYVVCAFDTHAPTFRHEEFPEYKGTRKPTDQSLIDQFPMAEEILKAFNIPILKKDGYEADDILGSLAKHVESGKWSEKNLQLYILSGDRDLLQLVGESVRVCLPSGGFKNLVEYDREGVFKYLGIYPEQVVDFKAVAGDSSDNIPGVKGVGEKTVMELLSKYGDIDSVYRNLGELKTRQANLLREGVEQMEVSRMLAKIEQDVDISIHLEECLMRDFDKNRVVEIFKKYAFKSLVGRLGEIDGQEEAGNQNQLDIFSVPEDVKWDEDVDLSGAVKLFVAHIGKEESSVGFPYYLLRVVDKLGVKANLKTRDAGFSPTANCETMSYNWATPVSHQGSKESELFDVALFAHLIGSERKGYTLRDLSFDYSSIVLNEKISPQDMAKVLDAMEEIESKQKEIANNIELYEYTKQSIEGFLKIKDQYLLNVLKEVEIPISNILTKMEDRGILVDIEHLDDLDIMLQKEISKISKEIYQSIGHEFNINSPKQLSDVLFIELDLPKKKGTSTQESVLQELVGMHPCIEKILEYRELNKMQTTYTKPLLEMAKEDPDSTIHTEFNQTGTTSGRFSSTNPNMQNIPLQGKWAEELRKSFIARKGFKLVAIDYSQMELRIMADISKDDLLIRDFNEGLDIHTSTASRILGKEMEEISKKERSVGKTVNFGILFGQTSFGLASMLGIGVDEAKEYIQNYFENYKGVEEYIRGLEKEAYKKGYVQSMFGTTRHIRGLRSKNIRMVRAAQREAVNMPIQGSEADIMKLAMIKIDEEIQKNFENKAHTILQIHDELIFEVAQEEVDAFVGKAMEIMENVVSLEVPLVVNSSVGDNMSELK